MAAEPTARAQRRFAARIFHSSNRSPSTLLCLTVCFFPPGPKPRTLCLRLRSMLLVSGSSRSYHQMPPAYRPPTQLFYKAVTLP